MKSSRQLNRKNKIFGFFYIFIFLFGANIHAKSSLEIDAAIESALGYATDLTAQYELGYNAVSDVNFSMETAHLAKNQILQQAATAMLAQANTGQQSLLQLIQG